MFRIVIDAGHTKDYNKGVIGNYYEGNQMFRLSQFEKEEFEQYENVEVVLTRNKLTDNPSLATRGKMAKGFDLFMSNHSNAPAPTSTNYSSIRGVSVLDSVTRSNKSVAEAIGKTVAKTMVNNFRGVVYRRGNNGDYYGVLRNAVASNCKVAILIEHGFHTNKEDCSFLMNDANLKRLAKAKVETIAQIFGLKKISSTEDKKYYTVRKSWGDSKSQIGAFLSLEGAKVTADNNEDYNVYDWNGKLVYTGGNIKFDEEFSYHIVVKGDTLWDIAHEYSMTVKELKELNNLRTDLIYPGDKLRLNSKIDVDKKTQKILKVGSKVKVIQGSKTYDNKPLANFVYQNKYDVIQIDGNRVVIGKGKSVTAAIHKSDLILL